MTKLLIVALTVFALSACGSSNEGSVPDYATDIIRPNKIGSPVSLFVTYPKGLGRGNVGYVNAIFSVDSPIKDGVMYVSTEVTDGIRVLGDFNPVSTYDIYSGSHVFKQELKIRTDARDYVNDIEYVYFNITTIINGQESTTVYAVAIFTKGKTARLPF